MSDVAVSFDEAAAQRAGVEAKNDRSTIEFSYADLEDGVEVARAIYARAGLGSCEIDELSAQMGQTISGSFRLKTAAGRHFGLVEKDGRSGYRLSSLGQRLVREESEPEARAAAFLAAPLYRAIFEKYRGHLLPPTRALEREISALGVAPKQVDKARRSFFRSARQAGFFAQGEDRLVQPRFDRSPETKQTAEGPPSEDKSVGGGGGGSSGGGFFGANGTTSFEKELLSKFPSFDPSWSEELKTQWFNGFQQFLAMAKGQPGKE